MFVRSSVIRSKHCTRLFSSYADNCPDCLARSPRGWTKLSLQVFAVCFAIGTVFFLMQLLKMAR